MKVYNVAYPIFVFPLKEHYMIKQTLLKMIDEQKSSFLKHDIENVISDWNVEIGEERKYFTYFSQYLNKYLENVLKHATPSNVLHVKYEHLNVWFQQYYKNYFHEWHDHGATWATIYFLELPDKSVSTEFYIPLAEKNYIQFDVEEGDILLFPANIFHRSSLNPSDNRKTVIVSNFTIHHSP